MNTFNLTLDLDKRGGVAQWVTLRQGDHNGTELRATIYDHGTQAGGGYTCRVSIRLPGAGDEYYRETATYTNGVAVVTVDEEYAAAIVGVTEGYFELLQGDAVIASTESFGVRILRSAQDGAVPGDKYDSAIDDALAELDEATGRISQMVVDATEEYLEAHPELTTTVEDNSLTDAKLIQHGGILDRVARLWHRLDNLLTNTPAESDALTVTDAAKTPLAGLALYGRSTQDGTPTPSAPVAIQSVTPNLLDLTTCVTKRFVSKTTGGIGTSDGWSATDYIPVVAGQAYILSGIVNSWSGVAGIAFYNASKTFVSGMDSTVYTFTAPSGASYVRLSLSGEAPSGVQFRNGSTPAAAYTPYGCVGLWALGANLLHLTSVYSVNGATATISGDSITVTATSASAWSYGRIKHGIPKVDADYALSFSASNTSSIFVGVDFMRADDTRISYATTNNLSMSFHVPTGTAYLFVYFYSRKSNTGSVGDTNTFSNIQLELGSTATAYQPYAESTTPIDLQGHELRSLPDGTRDEVTVDQYGHATLIQRVAVTTIDGSRNVTSFQGAETMGGNCTRVTLQPALFPDMASEALSADNSMSDRAVAGSTSASATPPAGRYSKPASGNGYLTLASTLTSLSDATAWLAENPVTIQYPLATPVTIDLGTIDPIALQGPDMTAQAVPTAPFALTYERDLNVTLARLEAAIAEVATS